MKKSVRLLALLLALLFCAMPLSACDGDGGDDVDGGGKNDDGSVNWEEVDFKGTVLKAAISAAQDPEVTFGPADVYLQGPDSTSTDEVMKKVVSRNTKVKNTLNISVEYIETDCLYNEVFPEIEAFVLGSSEDAPDLYINDMYGLNRAMVAGYLMNLSNPVDKDGNPVTSYFDFSYSGWNYNFMKGETLDASKVYIMAGDYFIDMIRMAWILYVNKTMFNQNASLLGAKNVEEFYEYVLDGIWDYEMMRTMCGKIWQDNGTQKGLVEENDGRVGIAIHNHTTWIFSAATGLTPFYLDEKGKATVLPDIDEYNRMNNALSAVTGASVDGIYHTTILGATDCFIKGNFLFSLSVLGELESNELRDISFEKGLVPMPKYDANRQDDYHTMVHDQTELGSILVTTTSFGRASAFMQYSVEESHSVLTEYYEFSLKFKYNEEPAIRKMIDCIYESIDVPFGMQFENIILGYGDELEPLYYGILRSNLSEHWDSSKQAYRIALDKALSEFAKIP